MGFFNNSKDTVYKLNKGFLYHQLPDELRSGYDTVGNGILSFQKSIRVMGVSERSDIIRILDTVMLDNPGLCYFNPNEFQIGIMGQAGVISVQYIYDRRKALQIMGDVDEKANFILSQIIADDMTDYDKCLAVHDYMTENIHYNFSAVSVNYVYDAFTAEGSILKHQAVCIGIAKAVALLLMKLGIFCTIVQGMSNIDGKEVEHAWNIIEINKRFYHIDATWDLQEINHFTSRSHMYMNLDDESMLNNHSWNIESYPTCNSNLENYYVKERRYFRTIRSYELYCRRFLKEKNTYMDVRFEDTIEIPNDNGRMLADILIKQAALLGIACQISHLFNSRSFVFQSELHYI